MRQAWKVLKIERPAVLLGFGGFASAPGALAGVLRRLPLVIHESNAVAGRANRLLRRFARRILVAYSDVLAGGEVVGGQVVGETDDKAQGPVNDGFSPDDLAATFFRNIGIDPKKEYQANVGRPITLVRDGNEIPGILK